MKKDVKLKKAEDEHFLDELCVDALKIEKVEPVNIIRLGKNKK